MGFTTGLLAGTTLTSLTLYLTLSLHTRNRLVQASLLRQQTAVLSNILDPQPPVPEPTTRIARAGLLETAKDRWNGELEREVRLVYNTDWRRVREGVEDRLAGVIGRLRAKGEEVKEEVKREV
ncbi:uncharacterized protein BDZ99DRAFT_388729 [Mytilinidion resinicola]|uniref:MICOS complex subunit MIC12 n=1 Tax=Mytilinidion resinicola TaxID=574789 RepID=A0A6A6YLZ4_9PEZI|nr:uncharacterized protein BDZ99DRAFT_388729 [Mytilinidion resinicola]KAF2809801.1 hypothetical protein BDZ99DRAFT_388729 [Mytilinidion resinicola]